MPKHEHIILSGTYKDVMLCTILRDPVDAISSNVDRWFEGYVGSTIQGIHVKNFDQVEDGTSLSAEAKKFIEQEKELYVAYLIVINNNIDRITAFTYDQIKNNPIESINNILSMFEMDTQSYNHEEVKLLFTKPSSDKGSLYGEIRKYLGSNMEEVYTLYSEILEKVSTKQETYPVKLNPVKL